MAFVFPHPTLVSDRISWFFRKLPAWAVYLVGLAPVPWLLYQAQTGGLGREPISALEHELGLIALQLMIGGLCISPVRHFLGVNLMKFRRAIGVLAFTYVALHLLVWLVLDVANLGQIWSDILKRPYITIGMLGFVLMLPLVMTSNNFAVRKLGSAWRKLHLLTYPAAILGVVHYIMVQKVWELEPILYLGAVLLLLALRLPVFRKRRAS